MSRAFIPLPARRQLRDLPDSRTDVYRALADTREASLDELTDATDLSKSTVYRALGDLDAEGLASSRVIARIGAHDSTVWAATDGESA